MEPKRGSRSIEENRFIVFCPRKRTTDMASSKVYGIDLREKEGRDDRYYSAAG